MTKEEKLKYLQTLLNTKINSVTNKNMNNVNMTEMEFIQKKCIFLFKAIYSV